MSWIDDNLALLLAGLFALPLVAWVSWRAGHDAAWREAEYTIAMLRRALRRAETPTHTRFHGGRP